MSRTPSTPTAWATPSSRANTSLSASATTTPTLRSRSLMPPRRSSVLTPMFSASRRTSAAQKSSRPSLTQSLLSMSVNCSTLLESASSHILEAMHIALPVSVAEILTLAESVTDVSVSMSTNGWAWLVQGRRLVVWRYQQSQSRPGTSASGGVPASSCRELTLPASDLAHDARLVNVFFSGSASSGEKNQTPSCIAVSPEGVIRYWPSIAHDTSFFELSADLQGQECATLTDMHPLGSVLSTTTATIVLVYVPGVSSAASPYTVSGPSTPSTFRHPQGAIACRVLKAPQGLLGGIGRRVSSLFFGGMSSASVGGETKLVSVVGRAKQDFGSYPLMVLTATSVQKWLLSASSDFDRLLFSLDVEPMVREAFVDKIWSNDGTSPSWLSVWLLDMQFCSSRDAVSVLMAAVNPQLSQQVHYAVGTLNLEGDAAPTKFASFCALKHSSVVDEDASGANAGGHGQAKHLSYRFLQSDGRFVYVYNQSSIICSSALADYEEPDVFDLGSSGDSILGAGYSLIEDSGMSAVFFSASHGMVVASPTAPSEQSMLQTTLTGQDAAERSQLALSDSFALHGLDPRLAKLSDSLNLSMSEVGLENLTASEAKSDQLRAAFLMFCKGSRSQSISIVDQLFPSQSSGAGAIDSNLDTLVLAMSRDMVDDFPASDPRWMESVPASKAATGSTKAAVTMSLLILHQLEDKLTALQFYISFLKDVDIWQRLSGVTVRGSSMATTLVLLEHFEKIAAAIALRSIHSEYQEVVDKAIRKTLADRGVETEGNLTPQDHFYRQVSRVEEIVCGLQAVVAESLRSDLIATAMENVMAVNRIVVTVFGEAVSVRTRKLPEFSPESGTVAAELEFVPWTSSPGPDGIRKRLEQLFKTTCHEALPAAEDSAERNAFCKQLVEIADLVLDGFRFQLELDKKRVTSQEDDPTKATFAAYEKTRSELIMPLVTCGFYQEAASLAEKYYEFAALIRICEATSDQKRLDRYMDTFADFNFSDFVFDYHIRHGKQGKMLSEAVSGDDRRKVELGRFLRRGGNEKFSWIHDLASGDYARASETLGELADIETELIARKKIMLSVAKLSALASDESDEAITSRVTRYDEALDVIESQEQLPRDVLNHYGFEGETMRVFNPREIIEMYIDDANVSATFLDFKKALDLLHYVKPTDDTDLEQVRLHIWAKAVGRGNWSEMDVDNPLESIKNTLFFRLVEICFLQSENPEDMMSIIPDAHKLLDHPEIGDLRRDPKFKFLLQSGYEHVFRVVKRSKDEEMASP